LVSAITPRVISRTPPPTQRTANDTCTALKAAYQDVLQPLSTTNRIETARTTAIRIAVRGPDERRPSTGVATVSIRAL
jgi:hypothetical protein